MGWQNCNNLKIAFRGCRKKTTLVKYGNTRVVKAVLLNSNGRWERIRTEGYSLTED